MYWLTAFLDTNPIIQGYTILITKRHCETIWDLNNTEIQKIEIAMRYVSDKLKKFDLNININHTSGKYTSQSISHFHFNLIPINKEYKLWDREQSKIILDRSSGFERFRPTKEKSKRMAEKIK